MPPVSGVPKTSLLSSDSNEMQRIEDIFARTQGIVNYRIGLAAVTAASSSGSATAASEFEHENEPVDPSVTADGEKGTKQEEAPEVEITYLDRRA